MLFAFIGIDKKDGAKIRTAKVTQHLDYLRSIGKVKLAGPFLNEKGDMTGSLIVLEAASRGEAQAWINEEPFHKAGLFEKTELHPWFSVMNSLERA